MHTDCHGSAVRSLSPQCRAGFLCLGRDRIARQLLECIGIGHAVAFFRPDLNLLPIAGLQTEQLFLQTGNDLAGAVNERQGILADVGVDDFALIVRERVLDGNDRAFESFDDAGGIAELLQGRRDSRLDGVSVVARGPEREDVFDEIELDSFEERRRRKSPALFAVQDEGALSARLRVYNLNDGERLGRITEAFEVFDAHAVGHCQEEIGHGLPAGFDVASSFEGATTAAGENERQVVMSVAVAVRIAAAIDDHGIVEE